MPQFGQYRVYLLDHDGDKTTQLFPGDDFLSISWEHRRNEPGAYALELVGETTTHESFIKHYQVLIERNWGNDPADWYEEYVGFHLGYNERWPTDETDQHYWSSLGFSPEWLIDQPLLLPMANVGNDSFSYYDLWWDSGHMDDVVKRMVSESMTSPADTDRIFTQMAVEGNEGLGTWSCYEDSWIRLLNAVTDAIGQDGTRGNCDFRVERVSGGYEFRTYSPFFGTDRRRGNSAGNRPTIFSFENGNIRNPQRQVMWSQEITVAYGGWQGTGMDQNLFVRENTDALAETPYSRREAYYDLDDIVQPDTINSILDQYLIDDGLKTYVTAEILQTDACLYGRDWWFGDLVTLDLPDDTSYDMRIIEVNGKISGDNEEKIGGVIELWTREEGA